MPTNLPPEYFAAEQKYRAAESVAAKISSLEELIGTIPRHKGTDKLRAELRRKLARLKSEQKKKRSTARHESEFHIDVEGSARIVITGAPNTGKSSLLATLTHAEPKISESPFTTWLPQPGMMDLEDIRIQLIDTPPLNMDHNEAELFDLIRSADLVLLMVDLQASPLAQLDMALQILRQHRIVPDHWQPDGPQESPVHFLPVLLVVNKDDEETFDEDFDIFCQLLETDCPLVAVSVRNRRNLNELKKFIFKKLDIIRIYGKPPGKDVDYSRPFVLKRGSTLADLALKVHQDFYHKLKNARVWGTGVYDGQLVGREHVLHDKDIVELHI